MPDSWDDEELLAALGEAMRAWQAVPEWFVETGKNAYAWHDIDAEMAQLTYDSLVDRERLAVVRSEAASIRALAFTSARLSIELEVAKNSLLGQIIPPRADGSHRDLQLLADLHVRTRPVERGRVGPRPHESNKRDGRRVVTHGQSRPTRPLPSSTPR